MATKKKLFLSAAGSAGGGGLDVDEVFKTFLFNGSGSTSQDIVNGIDLSGEGGLVWHKSRSNDYDHALMDTENGVNKFFRSNTSATIETLTGQGLTSFNSNGYTIVRNSSTANPINGFNSSYTYVSWTFRKAPKFFDIVTWSGNGAADRQISHNLDSVPGMIIVKRLTGGSEDIAVWHREIHANSSKVIALNQTAAAYTSNSVFEQINPTSSYFYVGDHPLSNASGSTYAAYLFAHHNNDGEFGPSADQDIIKCGMYIGNQNTNGPEVNLGFEPQWLLVKNSNRNSDWLLLDNMRGWSDGDADFFLETNTKDVEQGSQNWVDITSTGFKVTNSNAQINGLGEYHIYMAIRRGSLFPPDDATKVFTPVLGDGSGTPSIKTNHVTDFGIAFNKTGGGSVVGTRLLGTKQLKTHTNGAEATNSYFNWDFQNGWHTWTGLNTNYINWNWKRAPGYFDTVLYTGTGSNRTVTHNLGVAPEMMWIKARVSGGYDWMVYHNGGPTPNRILHKLNEDGIGTNRTAFLNDTAPAETQFTVGTDSLTNSSGTDYVAYLFATVAGVSKVGSYTGTGSDGHIINCGFSNGARFILIRLVGTSGSWYIFDTTRGIVTGGDPYLKLDTQDAQASSDLIDPHSSGFIVNSSALINANGYTHIFYTIA